jgi:hypothetical protein
MKPSIVSGRCVLATLALLGLAWRARNALFLAYERRRYRLHLLAELFRKRTIRNWPSTPAARWDTGRARVYRDRPDAVVRCFDAIITTEPHTPVARVDVHVRVRRHLAAQNVTQRRRCGRFDFSRTLRSVRRAR